MAATTSFYYAIAVIVLTCVYSVYGQHRATPSPRPCTYGTGYQCNDGNGCYGDYDKCDSYNRCDDKTDDLNCDYCSDYNTFHCESSRQCLSSYKVCNKEHDCSYGEDEDIPECHPSIWMYWSGGQLVGLAIGFVLFLVIVIAIVVVVHKNCKK